MNRIAWRMHRFFVVGLVLVAVSPFVSVMHGQEADSSAQAPGAPIKKMVRERTIERFSVDKADIRSVLKQISEYAGVDIVVADKVTSIISLTVTDKNWKEILSIVCKIGNLTALREPNYIYVVPTDEYRKQQLADASMNQADEAVSELKREVIRLSNVNAQEMNDAIKTMLSTRGKITVVERNNALIIFDTEENIEQIRKTIHDLDVETDQVSISCKIIEVSSGALQSLGVRMGYFDRINGTSVSAEHLPIPATASTGANVATVTTSIIESALERLTFGVMGQDKFSLALEYLFQNNKAEVIAQPQITTLDNKEAKIFMGSQVPVKYLDKAFNTVVQMIDAGTELVVVPHVTGGKRIMLDLAPKKRSYTLTGDNLPVVNEQSAKTNVVVSDGETVVIAGLTSNEAINTEEGVPVLKDIPLIGNLFKRSKKTLDKKDLIIFVTPHIINKKVEAATTSTNLQK